MSSFEIRQSSIHSKGLFAARDIKRGEIVTTWNPKILSKAQASQLEESERQHYTITEGDKVLLMQPPERYMNHSCSANTYTVNRTDVALRDIPRGEEITSDYLTFELEGAYCHCGSNTCRKPSKNNET